MNDLESVSPILLELGFWETFVCVWSVLVIFAIVAISMARSKNTGKGKATALLWSEMLKKERSICRKL